MGPFAFFASFVCFGCSFFVVTVVFFTAAGFFICFFGVAADLVVGFFIGGFGTISSGSPLSRKIGGMQVQSLLWIAKFTFDGLHFPMFL